VRRTTHCRTLGVSRWRSILLAAELDIVSWLNGHFMPIGSMAPEARAYLALAALFAAVFGTAFGFLLGPWFGVIGAAYGFACAFAFRHMRRGTVRPSRTLAPFSTREAYRLFGAALGIWLAVSALAFLAWRVSR
jgi:hypothetical protein